jgi:hypothetical protein
MVSEARHRSGERRRRVHNAHNSCIDFCGFQKSICRYSFSDWTMAGRCRKPKYARADCLACSMVWGGNLGYRAADPRSGFKHIFSGNWNGRTMGARSTTSILIAIFMAGIMFSGWFLNGKKRRARMTFFSMAGVLVISLFLALLAFFPNYASEDAALSLAGKDKTFTGRTKIWEEGWRVFEMKPIAGWSFDSSASVLSRTSLQTGQFHNGYLDLAVRGGLILFCSSLR